MLKYTTISALVLSIAVISTNTASADGHKKFLPTNVIGMNVISMNGIMAPKKSYTTSPPTASAGGYTKANFKLNVLSTNIIIMNGIMAPKKSYTKSRPTASAGGYKKAKFKRNVLVIEMNGRKATRK